MPSYRFVLPQLRRPNGVGRRRGLRGLVRSGEEGFSLVEVVISIGVFAIIATFMAGMLAGGLRGALTGKRREVATQEGNRILEVARSLSYADLGLVQTDPTIPSDPAIQIQPPATGARSYLVNGVWEPIIWATNSSDHPFTPHISAVERGSTSLTRYVYVSGVDTTGNGVADTKRVTVRVAWRNAGGTGPINEIRAQTLVNESGAVPNTGGTTPLTGNGFASGGSLSISSSLLNLGGQPLHINLPTSAGQSTFRAISNTNCTTKSANVEVQDLVDLDGYSVSVTADDDPRTSTPSNPAPQSSTGVLTIPGGPVSSLLGATIGSPISCEADVNALGHELGTGSALSALNAGTNVVALSGLLNWLLTVASVQTLPVTQSIDHEVVSDQREVSVNSTVAGGLVNVLKIPGVIPNGLIQVDGLSYGASVRGAEGTPSVAPTITSPAINLRIFDNNNALPNGSVCNSRSGGYCIVSVNPSAAGFNGLSIPLQGSLNVTLGLSLLDLLSLGLSTNPVVSFTYAITVDILPAAKSPAAGVEGPNGERRWSAEYTPIVMSASLDATLLGVTIIDTDVDLNLGTVRAEGCAGSTCT